jgi:hypothetical protein
VPWAILVALFAVLLYAWAQGSNFDDLTGEISTMGSAITRKIAEAIAHAEGFYTGSGTVPQRANNPGDLKLKDNPLGTIGGKTIFQTVEEGWAALEKQIEWMLTGQSRIYSPDMTIQEVANWYVNGTASPNADSVAWANNVARRLGVSPETPIGTIL